jgi:hypothetical protein
VRLTIVLLILLAGCADHSDGYSLQWRYNGDGVWTATCYCGEPLIALDEHDGVVCTKCGRWIRR